MRIYAETSVGTPENAEYFTRFAGGLSGFAGGDTEVTLHVEASSGVLDCEGAGNGIAVETTLSPMGYGQTWAHRGRMIEKQDDYDVFLYSECDLLFHPAAISRWMSYRDRVRKDWIVRFVRFEEDEDGSRHFLGLWGERRTHEVGDDVFVSAYPHYAACWALTREDLKRVIKEGAFSTKPRDDGLGVRETAVLEPLVNGFEEVVTPGCFPDALLVKHMPAKYLKSRFSAPLIAGKEA